MPSKIRQVTTLLETLKEIAIFRIGGNQDLVLDIATSDDSPLDQFVVSGRSNNSAIFRVLYDKTTDFISPQGHVFGASGDLVNLPANSFGWLKLSDLKGWYEIKIEAAQAAGDTTTVTAEGGLS